MQDTRRLLGYPTSKRMTAVEHVREALRNGILRGDLPGGSRLIQTDIASELGTSTTPVREAMRELASDGLITLVNHRVGIVRKPDWHEMQEIVDMRHALESLAIERAIAHITPEQLDEARELAIAMAGDEVDLGTWVQLNINFHAVFHNATDAVRLAPVLISLDRAAGLFAAQAQLLDPEIRQRGIEGHFALIEAVERKDLEKALDVEHRHTRLPLEAAALRAIDPTDEVR